MPQKVHVIAFLVLVSSLGVPISLNFISLSPMLPLKHLQLVNNNNLLGE
jgi:hypothetical protein